MRSSPPLSVLLGATGLGVAIGQLVQARFAGDPRREGIAISLAILLAVAAAVGAVQLWRRLSTSWRAAAAPAYAALLIPPFAALIDPERGGSILAAAVGGALVAALAGRSLRTGREDAIWLAVPGAAVGLTCLLLGAPLLVVPLAAVAAGLLGAVRPGRLAFLAPLSLLPLTAATRVVFTSGGQVEGGFSLRTARVVLVAAILVLGTVIALSRRWRPVRLRALILFGGLPALVAALSFQYGVHGEVELDEGIELAAVTQLEHGRAPALTRGLGPDVIRPAVIGVAGEPSLRSLRVLRDLAWPLERAALVVIGALVLPARWALLYGLAVAGLPALGSGGSLPIHLAVIAALAASRRRRIGHHAIVGVLAGALLGVAVGVVPAPGLALLVAAVVAGPGRRKTFAAGIAAGVALVAVASLAGGLTVGQLAGAVPASLGLVTQFDPRWGAANLGWLLVLVAVVAGRVTASRSREPSERLLWWYAALVAVHGFVAGGGPLALGQALVACAPVIALVVARLPAERALASLGLALLIVPVASDSPLAAAGRRFAAAPTVAIDDLSLLWLPPGDVGRSRELGVMIPVEQARAIAPAAVGLRALEPDATFFDFTDRPELHFLADRPPPTGVAAVSLLTSSAAERRLVAALADDPPARVVYRSFSERDAPGGISKRARHPRLAAWIAAEYRPVASYGSFLILGRGRWEPSEGPIGAKAYDVTPLGSSAVCDDRTDGTGTAIEIGSPTMTGGLALAIGAEQRARTEVIELAIDCAVVREAKLRWRLPAHRGLETGLTFAALPGVSRYRLPVAALPAWVWPARIDGLELVAPGCTVRRLVALDAPLDRALP